MIPELMCGAVC